MIGGVSMWGIRRTGRGGFDPRTVSGLILWLDASRGITLNGSDVSAWADQSGEGNDLTQATPSNQPLFVSSLAALNNMPAIKGAGSDHLDRATFTGGNVAQEYSIYQVITWTSLANTKSLAGGQSGTTLSTREFSGDFAANFGTSNVASGVAEPASGTAVIRKDMADGASSTIHVEVQGGASSDATYPSNPGSADWVGMSVLAQENGGLGVDGHVSEILMYNNDPSAPDDAAILAYLRSRYAIVTV